MRILYLSTEKPIILELPQNQEPRPEPKASNGGTKTWTVKNVLGTESETKVGLSESAIGTKKVNVLFAGMFQTEGIFVLTARMMKKLNGWKLMQTIRVKMGMILGLGRNVFCKPSSTPIEPWSCISGGWHYLRRLFGAIFLTLGKPLDLTFGPSLFSEEGSE